MSKQLLRRGRLCALALSAALALCLVAGFTTAQTTYVIYDSGAPISVAGYAGNPEGALARAGVALSPADQMTVRPGDQAVALEIRRAKTVSLQDGESYTTVTTYDETVGQVLSRLGRVPGQYDALSVPAGTPVSDGLRVELDRAQVAYETEYRPIPYETVRQSSSDLYQGEEQIVQPGAKGQDAFLYRTVTLNSGASREVVSYTEVSRPVSEVVAYGTKVRPSPRSYLSVTSNAITHIEEDGDGGGVLTTSSGQSLPYAKVLDVKATAYTTERQAWKKTATGTTARVGAIAVDPNVIPYGTKMYIQTSDGSILYGVATAEDCGSGVTGNRVDLFFNTYEECIQFGVRSCTVYILA